MTAHSETVVIAMSGGVDSSVAAALLVEQGYNVVGMMLRLWSEPGTEAENRCCTPDSMALARKIASTLKIPFYAIDSREIFYQTVVAGFLKDYANGLTPNPCVTCNRQIRWGYLLEQALAIGGNFLATGHYARVSRAEHGKFQLLRGIDPMKDQSYVLHVLDQHQLSHSMFPLGNLTKPETRELARKFDLPVADKTDSQDLCFLGAGDYQHFLLRNAPEVARPGDIVNSRGEVLGGHEGLAFYTIGQRKGIKIAGPEPLYVIAKDLANNTLQVGTEDELGCLSAYIRYVNWIDGMAPTEPFFAKVKIRYRAAFTSAFVLPEGADGAILQFEKPVRDLTPGQAAVFYNGDIVLGGGMIMDIVAQEH